LELIVAQSKPVFHASQEKIKRAQRKLRDLESSVNTYLAAEPYSVRVDVVDKRVYVITRRDKEVPEDFAFEVVETVGHLRSALDKMMVAIVEANGRGTGGVGFPFGGLGNNGEPLPFPTKRMEDGIKKKLTPDQWALILAYKPRPRGNNALWAINEIANTDKHRKDLVEVIPNLDGSVGIGRPDILYTQMRNIRFRVSEDNAILSDQEREEVLVSFDAWGVNPHVDCRVAPRVIFGNVMPVKGKNILVTVNQQIRLVEDVIASFKKTLP
jgi:hypothetical protein